MSGLLSGLTLPRGQILPSLWPGSPACKARCGNNLSGALLQDPVCQSPSPVGPQLWLEKWAFFTLQIHSLNTQLTPFRLHSQGSRTLASKRSKGARQSPDLGTPQRREPLAQACSPRTAALLGQHLILLFFRKTALPQRGAGLLWGVVHQPAAERWR